ncbi:alpha/beta hydrolase [Lacticaseibacillus sp. GG6-2]
MFREPRPFEEPGQDIGIVLLHAYTGSPNDMRLLGTALNQAGYGVYGPTFTGHGHADLQPVLAATPDQWWADTQKAVAHMAAKYPAVAVFGLSLGGVFAMKALEVLPSVTLGGVLSSPIVAGEQHIEPQFLAYNRYLRRLAELPDNAEAVRPQLRQQLAAIAAFTAPVAAALPAVTKPVFIGQAGADEMIDPQRAKQLRTQLTHATVDFHWYEDASHVITVNNAHRVLETDIINFMKTRDN